MTVARERISAWQQDRGKSPTTCGGPSRHSSRHRHLGQTVEVGLASRTARCSRGSFFVLFTGIRWDHVPLELGYGSGVTCWRRLGDWQEAGVWDKLHEALLAKLNSIGEVDLSRVIADASHIQAKRGARKPEKAL